MGVTSVWCAGKKQAHKKQRIKATRSKQALIIRSEWASRSILPSTNVTPTLETKFFLELGSTFKLHLFLDKQVVQPVCLSIHPANSPYSLPTHTSLLLCTDLSPYTHSFIHKVFVLNKSGVVVRFVLPLLLLLLLPLLLLLLLPLLLLLLFAGSTLDVAAADGGGTPLPPQLLLHLILLAAEAAAAPVRNKALPPLLLPLLLDADIGVAARAAGGGGVVGAGRAEMETSTCALPAAAAAAAAAAAQRRGRRWRGPTERSGHSSLGSLERGGHGGREGGVRKETQGRNLWGV